MLDTVWFLSVLLTALAAGLALSHVLEIGGKSQLPAETYLAVQQRLYRWFFVAGGLIEPGALAATGVLCALAPERGEVFWLTLVALVALTAMLVVWVVLTQPVNKTVNRWTADTLPPDWRTYRTRWEVSHAIRAGLGLISLSALLIGLLATSPG